MKQRGIVFLFFALYLFTGLCAFKDYGISWDEPACRRAGIVASRYITDGDQSLLSYRDRFYGTAFETFLVLAEKLLPPHADSRSVFMLRHLLIFLLFYSAVFVFYLLVTRAFPSRLYGLLGCLFLVLHPRIFAHSFYNSKDLPFLSLFIMSIYTLVRFLDRKTPLNALLHALTCALLLDIRISGIAVVLFTVIFLCADPRRMLKAGGTYLGLLAVFTVLFWPLLWQAPLHNLMQAFLRMSHFPWEGEVRYLGTSINASALPWHYAPVWIAVSTPLLYTVLFLAGCFFSAQSLIKNPWHPDTEGRDLRIFLLWFFFPLAAVIALKSTLYDEWRHLFFIYPAFVMLALFGLRSAWQAISRRCSQRPAAAIVAAVIAANLLGVTVFMFRNHPFQNVYFNRLAGRNGEEVRDNFDLDYWGVSYRQALEYIVKNDARNPLRICAANPPALYNTALLKPHERERLVFVRDPHEADYFVTNYRGHKGKYPYAHEPYAITVNGIKILSVFRLD